VISKVSVRSKKNKTKVSMSSSCELMNEADGPQLWAEIKLHGMLAHPNIVRFDECFEDEENVYMVLELCENGVSRFES
jgi:polo-like kinase 1